MILILLFVTTVGYFVYKWLTSYFDYFEKQRIPYNKPLPFFGSNFDTFLLRKNFVDVLQEWYYEFKDEKVSGLFELRRPSVLIKDPKIIKQLTVKDFDFFTDHNEVLPNDVDPLFSKNLFSMKGQEWKDMRATLSPAFTGSKMRQMFDYASGVGLQTAETMKKEIDNGKEFEFKELATKFTVDIIASCAFGIEINSFKNPENDFLKITNKLVDFASFKFILKYLGYTIFPTLMRIFKVTLLNKKSSEFFEEIIYETMRTREKEKIVRHDMIHLLLQAKKGQLTHDNNKIHEEKIVDGFATVEESSVGKSDIKRQWDDKDLAAQCLVFFLAGFDNIAQTISFIAYELACNPDIQQRLYEEIVETNNEAEGLKISYAQLQSMKYLDQVVSEAFRKWPSNPIIDRVCLKEYTLKYDDKVLKIEPDMAIYIPAWSIQRDPKYYPEPEKFDPDRFSDENKRNIDPDTYLPFGIGPRNCIGSRFAIMEIKTFIYYLLLNFSFEVTEKTQIPLQLEKTVFAVKPEKGIWVELKPRD